MANKRQQSLEFTLANLQKRWGSDAVWKLKSVTPLKSVQPISTGFSTLDEALGIGGIPRSCISEIGGAPTSGTTTLALNVAASAQKAGEVIVYVEMERSLDPDYMTRSGIDLEKLLVVMPSSKEKTLSIVYDLVTSRRLGVVIINSSADFWVDTMAQNGLYGALSRLAIAVRKSSCALLFLNCLARANSASSSTLLSSYADLRLWAKKKGWLQSNGEVVGYEVQVSILKNKLAPAGRKATISVMFADNDSDSEL